MLRAIKAWSDSKKCKIIIYCHEYLLLLFQRSSLLQKLNRTHKFTWESLCPIDLQNISVSIKNAAINDFLSFCSIITFYTLSIVPAFLPAMPPVSTMPEFVLKQKYRDMFTIHPPTLPANCSGFYLKSHGDKTCNYG